MEKGKEETDREREKAPTKHDQGKQWNRKINGWSRMYSVNCTRVQYQIETGNVVGSITCENTQGAEKWRQDKKVIERSADSVGSEQAWKKSMAASSPKRQSWAGCCQHQHWHHLDHDHLDCVQNPLSACG